MPFAIRAKRNPLSPSGSGKTSQTLFSPALGTKAAPSGLPTGSSKIAGSEVAGSKIGGNVAKGGWMTDESKREESAGTKGSFSKKAAKAGESTSKFAAKESSAPGKLGKQARMAKMFAKGRAAKSQSK